MLSRVTIIAGQIQYLLLFWEVYEGFSSVRETLDPGSKYKIFNPMNLIYLKINPTCGHREQYNKIKMSSL